MSKQEKINKAKEISEMLEPVVNKLNGINPRSSDRDKSKHEKIIQDAHRRLNRGLKKLLNIEEEIDIIIWLAYDDINAGLNMLENIEELEKDPYYMTGDLEGIEAIEQEDLSPEQKRRLFRKNHLKRLRELNPTAEWRK